MDDIFWDLKAFFPGDSEFHLENFYRLPCEYVTLAHNRAMKLRRRQLHESERPTALLTCMYANSNRDPKKKGYDLEQFFMYPEDPTESGPATRFGSAYLHLAQTGKLPSWALFCYKDVTKSAGGAVPTIPALYSEHAILLAPRRGPDGYSGLLIALEAAQGPQEFTSPCGIRETLVVPHIYTKAIADENATLKLLQ